MVTHEPFFLLLREKQSTRKQKKDAMLFSSEDFEILEISILRTMLEQHFRRMGMKMDEINARQIANGLEPTMPRFDLDRVIDDFVFMCFFVGNDFLPCLPHLDIADGSLNLMMNIYRDMMPRLGGYLTNKADIHLSRLEVFIQEIGRREPLYFQQRAIDEKDQAYGGENYKSHYYKMKFNDAATISKKTTECNGANEGHEVSNVDKDNDDGDDDEFHGPPSDLLQVYLQGLVWVLNYYHYGCASWTWYYPYLYAPLSTDMKDLATMNIEFEQGAPFTPLLQLLSVLPPQSGPLLPHSYSKLMTDEDSPLNEYYPSDFEVDPNGKKNSWEYIVKIPFLDETDLLKAVSSIDHVETLSETERIRNLMGDEHRFTPQDFKGRSRNQRQQEDKALTLGVGNALVDERQGRQGRMGRGGRSGTGARGNFNVRRRY